MKRTRKKKKKTYVQMASTSQKHKNEKGKSNEIWNTAEGRPKYASVIRLGENEDVRNSINSIKEIAKDELKATGGIKDIIKVSKSPMVLKFETKEQQTLITNKIKDVKTQSILMRENHQRANRRGNKDNPERGEWRDRK